MLKLRKILLYKKLYYIVFAISLIYLLIYLNINFKSKYKKTEQVIIASITDIKYNGNQLTLRLKGKEQLLATYYFSSKSDLLKTKKNLELGDKLKLKGSLKKPKETSNFYSFSYQDYLKHQRIFYLLKVEEFEIISKNKNIINTIKTLATASIKNTKTGSYINVFFLGSTATFDSKVLSDFRKLGISHLFALSGTQISFIFLVFQSLISRKKDLSLSKFISILTIILIYYTIINNGAAIDRALVFTTIFSLNKIFNFYIPPSSLILLSLSTLFFINPYYIYDLGFLYSTVISICLILYTTDPNYQKKNKVIELLEISWLSFLVSLPISLYHFSYLNPLSIIYNLFYVPFINIIIFPLSMLCFFFSFLSPILTIFIIFFERSVAFLSSTNFGIIILKRLPLIFYLFYYLLIVTYLFKKQKVSLYFLILCLFLNYGLPKIFCHDKLYMIDVGQGDSFLLISKNQSMLIDTGGTMDFNRDKSMKQEQVNRGKYTVTFLHQLGLSKLNYMIITHADYDHMGEAINLVNNFKVEKVIFNCGTFNDLEKELIKVLDKKKIKYYSCIKELDINNNKLYFLQTGEYDNENDNSNVIYTELNGYKFMFMGDAGVEKEKDILDKYNISDIDVLKVGHHGSKTSSSKTFIGEINPKYGIISVGKNNRYGHPNKEVLKTLNNSKIYRTDKQGSIMFKIKNNKLKIETCSP